MKPKSILFVLAVMMLLTQLASAATLALSGRSSEKLDAGFFPGHTQWIINVTGTVFIAPSFPTYPDGSLAALPPERFSWANSLAANYPTVDGGDGINHFLVGGLNYVPGLGELSYLVAGKLTTDTTDPDAIRFGAVVGTFSDSPTRSDWFYIGYGRTITIPAGGRHLYLLVNESIYSDNPENAYTVRVAESRARIKLFAGIYVEGIVGRSYRIDFVDGLPAGSNWTTLTNIVLASSPFLVFDYDPAERGQRFYRSVELP